MKKMQNLESGARAARHESGAYDSGATTHGKTLETTDDPEASGQMNTDEENAKSRIWRTGGDA